MAPVQLKNRHIQAMAEDNLYHLGIMTTTHNLPQTFGDVKFVCMGGTPNRMENFAHFIMKEIGYELPTGSCLQDISKHSHRYSMFKVGPVLSISHGMGVPSLSILLHEVIKLLHHAGAKDPIFFRIGTCGGVGLPGGSVVITEEALDGMLEPCHEQIILSRRVKRPASVDQQVMRDLIELGKQHPFVTVPGKTLCTNDFYEGQGRLDGAFCDYDESDKMAFLRTLQAKGVRNIEMEATAFAALTHHAGIRSAIVCVTLLDRLQGDQILTPKETMVEWMSYPQQLVAAYIKRCLREMKNGAKSAERVNGGPESVLRFTSYEDEKQNSFTSDDNSEGVV